MTITMSTTQLPTLEQMADFVSGSSVLDFSVQDKTEAYGYIERVIVGLDYRKLTKPAKGIVKAFLAKVTGLSRAQLTRLIKRQRVSGKIMKATRTQPTFANRYTHEDISIIAKLDELYERMSGQAMVVVFKREYEQFGNEACYRLKDISASHIYNLRQTVTYKRNNTVFTKTKPSVIKLGERVKPEPNGQPGFLRVLHCLCCLAPTQ